MGTGYVIAANADAGSACEEAVGVTAGVLRAAGPTELVPTRSPGDLDDVVAALGDRVLVVVGGDGSLHAAVNALRRGGRLDAAVGLVPLGTGNDFARGLGLPLETQAAAEALVAGRPRPMDLALVTTAGDRVPGGAGPGDDGDVLMAMVNVGHAGVGAEAAEAAGGLKERLGPAAYPVGAAWAGVTSGGWDLVVEVDGVALTPPDGERTLMVGVANGSSIGGGTALAPDAQPDDGLLDVVVVTATGPAARVGYARDLRQGDHVEREDVRTARGRVVRIAGEPVRHNVDGEVGEPLTDVTYTIVPASWALLAP
jgi:YegS/Rv2252/BmrU family lipid kinase